MSEQVPRVVIGMDPHKRSVTIEVMLADESVVGGGRFDTTVEGYQALLEFVAAWPQRVWAIEGCEGIGRHIAHRLLADEQDIVDVPAKLSARARVFATGQGRKTDATDAHSVALVGTRMAGLRPVVSDEQLEVLQLLVDRRRSIREEHTRKISQLHRLLLELVPGGAKKYLSAAQARTILAGVRPRDAAGKTRKRVAAELVVDLERIYRARRPPTRSSRPSSPQPGPPCWTCTASAHPAPRGCWSRSATWPGSPTATTSHPGPAPPRSTPPPATTSATASPAAGTDRSTACCTSWRPSSCAPPPKAAPTTTARRQRRKPRWKQCDASSGACPTSSTAPCSATTSPER